VAEYLLANGTERAAEEIIENSSQIAVCVIVAHFSGYLIGYQIYLSLPDDDDVVWLETRKIRICGA
jgi:hypothetical protein